MLITLAFYKGQGHRAVDRLQDAAIRMRTGGIYSHVELIEGSAALNRREICLSSSGRDGGVREAQIYLDAAKWDLLVLAVPSDPAEFIRQRFGQGYDYLAIVFSQAITAGLHERRRWMCSEIVAASIGLRNPHRFSPQLLHDALVWCAHDRISIA